MGPALRVALQQEWAALFQHRQVDPAAQNQVIETILDAYDDRSRHYHNLSHLAELFRHFHTCFHELQQPALVAFAIFFHDVVYDPTRRDNETRSAAFAREKMADLGFKPSEIDPVATFIQATQAHVIPENAGSDLAWFLDFDLAILGAEPAQYQMYIRNIRKEYRIYPDLLYKPGRKKVLHHFLERAHLFHTPLFREKYEQQARTNIRAELESL